MALGHTEEHVVRLISEQNLLLKDLEIHPHRVLKDIWRSAYCFHYSGVVR